jgi:hypothetical protein
MEATGNSLLRTSNYNNTHCTTDPACWPISVARQRKPSEWEQWRQTNNSTSTWAYVIMWCNLAARPRNQAHWVYTYIQFKKNRNLPWRHNPKRGWNRVTISGLCGCLNKGAPRDFLNLTTYAFHWRVGETIDSFGYSLAEFTHSVLLHHARSSYDVAVRWTIYIYRTHIVKSLLRKQRLEFICTYVRNSMD